MENEEVKIEEPKTYNKLTDEQKEEIIVEQMEGLIAKGITSFNAYDVQRKYPNTFAAYNTFLEEKANMKVEFDIAAAVLVYNCLESLFAFFDNNRLYINITGNPGDFRYNILTLLNNDKFESRSEATIAGFTKAFETLEEIIKS